MSTTLSFSPSGEDQNGLKIRVYRVRLTAWAHRFIEKVDASAGPDGCWRWTAGRVVGYGVFKLPASAASALGVSRQAKAHRIAWLLAHDHLPAPTVEVCHHCDNPSCVNPAHLFLGTRADNAADCKSKGRTARGTRNGRAKLSESQVADLRAMRAGGVPEAEVARRFGVSVALVSKIHRGKLWPHLPSSTRRRIHRLADAVAAGRLSPAKAQRLALETP